MIIKIIPELCDKVEEIEVYRSAILLRFENEDLWYHVIEVGK